MFKTLNLIKCNLWIFILGGEHSLFCLPRTTFEVVKDTENKLKYIVQHKQLKSPTATVVYTLRVRQTLSTFKEQDVETIYSLYSQ